MITHAPIRDTAHDHTRRTCALCDGDFTLEGGRRLPNGQLHPWCADCCDWYVEQLRSVVPDALRDELLLELPNGTTRTPRGAFSDRRDRPVYSYWSRRLGPGDRIEVRVGEGHPTLVAGAWVPERHLVFELEQGIPVVRGMRIYSDGSYGGGLVQSPQVSCVMCGRPATRRILSTRPTCSIECSRDWRDKHAEEGGDEEQGWTCPRCEGVFSPEEAVRLLDFNHPWCQRCIDEEMEALRAIPEALWDRVGKRGWWLFGEHDIPDDVHPSEEYRDGEFPYGTLRLGTRGTIQLRMIPGSHHRADAAGWLDQWVLVAEKELGVPIPFGIVARRADGNRRNDSFDNLTIFRRRYHRGGKG